ncbi:MAG: diversity-generating retroelement protein Avd [Caldilineaceae bacterium]|nr:diversity-generating retroelement protein Avd [Caldilineaceae bacterium]
MSDAQREMPLFAKTFDLLAWLIPATNHFPKLYRHTVTKRLLDATLNFQEAILTADALRGAARLRQLTLADGYLSQVRLYVRLAHRLRWLNDGQYQHVSRMIAEMGKLLGGWRKVT